MNLSQVINGGAVWAIAAAVATPAGAQVAYTRDNNKSVQERAWEEHRPIGIRTGGFLMLPQLDLGVEFNDNIYATQTNEQDDTIFVASPSVAFESQWSVHRLNLFGGITTRTFMDADDDNVVDWRVGADGQIDINRDMFITGRLFTGQETEPRFAGNGPANLVEPIEFEYTEAGVAFVRNVNRIRASLGVDYRTVDFEDGFLPGPINFDQDFRDFDGTDITARLDYAINPDTAIFASVTHRTRDYDFDAPLDRDSEGWRYLVGANFDVTATIRGEVGVGYSTTSYDQPGLADTDGLALTGRIEWFPTQLTTVTIDGLRDTVESDIGGASAIERTDFGVRVDHELRRDVILYGQAGWEKDEYETVDREDDRTRFGVGADWYVNRLVTAGASYTYREQESTGVFRDRDFDVNQVMFTLRLRR
jgi:hypothetical protein